jgi:hypothetical protein
VWLVAHCLWEARLPWRILASIAYNVHTWLNKHSVNCLVMVNIMIIKYNIIMNHFVPINSIFEWIHTRQNRVTFQQDKLF